MSRLGLRSLRCFLSVTFLGVAATVVVACATTDTAPPASGDTGVDAVTTGSDGLAGTDVSPSETSTVTDAVADVSQDATPPADVPAAPEPRFAFSVEPDGPLSAGPFPNDLLLGADGKVHVAPLEADPALKGLADPAALTQWTAYAREREGFSSTSAVFFFTPVEPDLASLEGRLIAVALTGPTAGKTLPVNPFWAPKPKALGLFPRFGHFLEPDTTYGFIVLTGPTAAAPDARPFVATPALVELVSPEEPAQPTPAITAARSRYTLLRNWLASESAKKIGIAASHVLVATQVTTEKVLAPGQALIAAIDGFDVKKEAPSRHVRWDADKKAWIDSPVLEAASLTATYGTPKAPHLTNPGNWGGDRKLAGKLAGTSDYDGGTFVGKVARVVHGSLVVPVFHAVLDKGVAVPSRLRFDATGKKALWDLTEHVPFTVYLCKDHLVDPSKLKVLVATHGGGATRVNASPFAALACQAGMATVAIDMPFHGGRWKTELDLAAARLLPIGADERNAFIDTTAKDASHVPDWIGDAPGNPAASVGPLYAIAKNGDPLVMEATTLSWTADTYTLVRYLRDADWSQIVPGLSFDKDHIYAGSLSFGSTYTLPLLALTDAFRAAVLSVGTGYVFSINMPMGPSNAVQAAGLVKVMLGLDTTPDALKQGSWKDLGLAVHAWLHERGDPLVYAPYVLRKRSFTRPFALLGTGNSWDETLFNPAQITLANALGLGTYTYGKDWTLDPTVPGAQSLNAPEVGPLGVKENLSVPGNLKFTAAIFYLARSCHAGMVQAMCGERFQHPYPPIVELAETIPHPSPICALHGQAIAFLKSITQAPDGPGLIGPPKATCDEVYGQNL